MVEAATNFRKSGFNDSDSAMLAQVAAQYQNIADTAVSAGDAAASIVSQIRAFGEDASFATTVINAYNEVANKFSVGTNDLSQAMEIASSGMATYGNEFSEIIGLVTAGTEIMQGRSSQVARGLSTIAARIVKNQDVLEEYGIAVENVDGSLKSTFDVLSELKPKWDSMTDAQRVALGDTLAGQNQYKVLASVMQNFQHAIDATNTALNSAGSAAKENSAYMESLEAREQALKAEFEDFANRVLSKELVGGFIDAGTAILDFANNDVGAAITRIGVLSTGITGLVGIAGQTVGKIAEVGLQLKNLGVGGGSFLGMLASGKVALIVGGVVLAITALVEIIRALKSSYDAAHPSFEQANENLEKTQDEISQTTDKLKEYKDQLAKLDEVVVEDRGTAWQNERSEIELNIEATQSYLDILERIRELQGQQAYEADRPTGYTAAGSITKNQFQDETYYGAYQATGDRSVQLSAKQANVLNAQYSDQYQALTAITLALADATDEQYRWIEAEDLAELQGKSQEEQIEIMTNMLNKLGIVLDTTYESSEQAFTNMGELANKTGELSQVQKEQAQTYIDSYDEIVKVGAATKEQVTAYVELAAKLNDVDIASGNAYETIALLANVLGVTPAYARDLAISMGLIDANTRPAAGALVQLENGTWAVADGLNAVKTASDGVGEAMSNISVATYDTSTAAAQLTASLFDQNGQLTEAGLQALSVDSSMRSMAQAELQAQQEAASANYSKLILEIQKVGSAAMITAGQLSQMMALAGVGSAQGLVGGLASGSSTDIEGLKSAFFRVFGKSADANVADFNKWVSSRISSAGQTTYDKIMEDTQKRLDEISKNFPSGGGGGSSGKSAEEKAAEEAEKQTKKAQQAQEKAAKESQEAYESAAKSAEQAAEQAAQAAEQAAQAAEKAAEEAKQKILDTISELKDASDEFWSSKTDAVEETNTELDRQKQLEEKLKALEEAKQKKILLYKNGQFQYDKDYGSIAKAQVDYEETRDKIQRERELEQLEEMKDNATEIFNEMKDIINNGGDVTQNMINKWLNNMSALGVDYYDSNKKLLSDWLNWAKSAITTLSSQITNTLGGYTSTSSYLSDGSYGSGDSGSGYWETVLDQLETVVKSRGLDLTTYNGQKEYEKVFKEFIQNLKDNNQKLLLGDTRGQNYMFDPMYYDDNNEFVGYAIAFWIDRFKEQLSSGFEPEEWLGGGFGTSIFDDWAEVLAHYAESSLDPEALEDMAERALAAKQVMKYYKDIFESLGYDEYADIANKIENLDISDIKKTARMKGAIAHPDNPFGMATISSADLSTVEGKLYNILSDLDFYAGITGSSAVGRGAASSELRYGAKLSNWHMADYTKPSDDLGMGSYTPQVRDVKYNQKQLEEFYKANEDAIQKLKELYELAQTDLERQTIHNEAEARREAREYTASLLGYDTGEITKAEREANENAGLTKKTNKTLTSIEEVLIKSDQHQQISNEYVKDAKDYIAKTIEETTEALKKTYTETEKEKLKTQLKQLENMNSRLDDIQSDFGTDTGGSKYDWEDTDFWWESKDDSVSDARDWLRDVQDEEVEDSAKKLREEMQKNAEAWWSATTDAEKEALHKRNEELANQIGGLTYNPSTGVWSKNANGTHNFRGGLSLVGENGPEMRILGKGDNIIPHSQTENLWKWSSTTPQAMLSTLKAKYKDNGNTYAFNVSHIELPNVTDAKSFVNGLKNYALQYSYKR